MPNAWIILLTLVVLSAVWYVVWKKWILPWLAQRDVQVTSCTVLVMGWLVPLVVIGATVFFLWGELRGKKTVQSE